MHVCSVTLFVVYKKIKNWHVWLKNDLGVFDDQILFVYVFALYLVVPGM